MYIQNNNDDNNENTNTNKRSNYDIYNIQKKKNVTPSFKIDAVPYMSSAFLYTKKKKILFKMVFCLS